MTDGAGFADDCMEADGTLKMFLARDLRVLGLDSVHQLCGLHTTALADTRSRRIGIARATWRIGIASGARTIRKVVWYFRGQNKTKAAVDIDERKHAQEMVAVPEAEFIERDRLDA